ncbi:hypothetical protein [Streptosporangium canum]|uniref:hypothetical protein n=1 Tax=Streptosporangium canum TaxID=324952 RepID=UPI00339ED04A
MLESSHVHVEIWPVAADEIGLWLLSGTEPWRSGPVPQDLGPRDEAQIVLDDNEVSDALRVIHSTSWRAEPGHIMLTYIAAVDVGGPARQEWPAAVPIAPELAAVVGKPAPTSPTGEPVPRYIDVLLHGIRHLRFLTYTDSPARNALGPQWRQHLEAWEPALSGMYEEGDARAVVDPTLLGA